MLVTEQEAAKKWCPFARVVIDGCAEGDVPPHNRMFSEKSEALEGNHVPPWSCCIGSRCMAWQWVELRSGKQRGVCGMMAREES